MVELDDDVLSPVVGRREILRTAASAAGCSASRASSYGLDVPVPLLLQELNTAPPLFAGVLDAVGGSAVSIPGVPAGLTIQIVGLHLNGAGIPLFASAPVSFTVN